MTTMVIFEGHTPSQSTTGRNAIFGIGNPTDTIGSKNDTQKRCVVCHDITPLTVQIANAVNAR